ncbi:hypothetical protein MTO96_023509 [Rhipicephalus appendiculatus]
MKKAVAKLRTSTTSRGKRLAFKKVTEQGSPTWLDPPFRPAAHIVHEHLIGTTAVKFDGIECDACDRKDITGTRWKCEVCFNYDLCDDCYKRGKHYQDHPFLRLKKPGGAAERVLPRKKSSKLDMTTIVKSGARFDGIRCSACNQTNISGIRWNCVVCVNYDLCLNCYIDNKHATHAFVRHDRSVRRSDVEAGATQHDGIICDDCGEDGIFGTRWKCLLCCDYDLCNSCYTEGEHNQEHAFLKLNKPGGIATRAPPKKTTTRSQLSYFTPGDVTFDGISCDSCGRENMVAPLWKCDVCANYDLCTFCYLSNEHNLDHGFVRLDMPRSRGIRVSARQHSTTAEMRPRSHTERSRGPPCDCCCRKHLPGIRWKCDACSDYNLCNDCYTSGKHRLDHGFVRFDSLRDTGIKVSPRKQSSEASYEAICHIEITCDACGERGIFGTRWKCQSCYDYDLCTACYKKISHSQEHAFLRIPRPGDIAVGVPPKHSDADLVDLQNSPQRNEESPTRTEVDLAAQRELERELRQIKESLDCSICLERRRNVAFLCGHSACAGCAENLKDCHVCRVRIEGRVTLY